MRPTSIGTREGLPAYDPQHAHYDLNGYMSRESFSDRESIETEQSIADNFTNKKTIGNVEEAGPSQVPHGQDDVDGYTRELYML